MFMNSFQKSKLFWKAYWLILVIQSWIGSYGSFTEYSQFITLYCIYLFPQVFFFKICLFGYSYISWKNSIIENMLVSTLNLIPTSLPWKKTIFYDNFDHYKENWYNQSIFRKDISNLEYCTGKNSFQPKNRMRINYPK